ncbi:MAG: YetF domain-containing protein [Armatimonadota bacterium]
MFFSSWTTLIKIAVVGVLAYAGLVILQRITGKRTLSKMNAFDLVVTVALGSALATTILSKTTALTDGLLIFALLMLLQYVVTWLSVRSKTLSKLVKSTPKMLFYQGEFLHDAMLKERVVEAEILQAIRNHGIANVRDVEAVVLETDGTFSVISRSNSSGEPSYKDVERPNQPEEML